MLDFQSIRSYQTYFLLIFLILSEFWGQGVVIIYIRTNISMFVATITTFWPLYRPALLRMFRCGKASGNFEVNFYAISFFFCAMTDQVIDDQRSPQCPLIFNFI